MDREKKAADCKVDSIGSGRAIPIKQVSTPLPCGWRAVEMRNEARGTRHDGLSFRGPEAGGDVRGEHNPRLA